MTDERLLKALQSQQQDAMDALMGKYQKYVYIVIANILGSSGGPEDIEELVQDTFYAIWTHADAIHTGNLKAYLGTTARNKAKSWVRSRRELPMALDMVEIPDSGHTLDDLAAQEELARYIRNALNRMRPKDREIFLRHYYYLQTTGEIASHMGIPVSTVCSRLMRGRKILKKSLSKEGLH